MGNEITFRQLIGTLHYYLPIKCNRELRPKKLDDGTFMVLYLKNNQLVDAFTYNCIIYSDSFAKVLVDLMEVPKIADLIKDLINNKTLFLSKFSDKQQEQIKSALFVNALKE